MRQAINEVILFVLTNIEDIIPGLVPSIHYISRKEYRNKHKPCFIEELKYRYGDFYLLPEGGSNILAVKGTEEIIISIFPKLSLDYEKIMFSMAKVRLKYVIMHLKVDS